MNRNLFFSFSLALLFAGCSQKETQPAPGSSKTAESPAMTNAPSLPDQLAAQVPTAALSQAASNATATATSAASSAMSAGSNVAATATSTATSAMSAGSNALGKLSQFGTMPTTPAVPTAPTAPTATPPPVLQSPKDSSASPSLASLSTDQVTGALKEALGKGLSQAVASLGTQDGFLTNMAVRIPLPDKLQTVEKALRAVGQGKVVDDFDTTMNRAAELAVPAAADVFTSALQNMSLDDAKAILNGTTNAATQYFRKATETQLTQKFLPIVQQATAKSGATAAYKNVMSQAQTAAPFAKVPSFDLDNYVTGKAMDGLFTIVAQEEAKIRANPAAQTSQLLKSVFGAFGK